jgi:hypothetical protein
MDDDFDDFEESGDSPKERIDELESRIEELEEGSSAGSSDIAFVVYGAFGYFVGLPLAMVLSWSRNASILYCIWHGSMSWAYVVYFALTR